MRRLILLTVLVLLAVPASATAKPRLSLHRAKHVLAVCERTWETASYRIDRERRASRGVIHLAVTEFGADVAGDRWDEIQLVYTVKLRRGDRHPRIYSVFTTGSCRFGVG